MIDRYLRELDAELRAVRVPRQLRSRILEEAREHLRSDPHAIERFGSPAEVAARWASHARPALGPAAALLAAVTAYVVPLYGIPENTLPPAPPEGLPSHLHALLTASLAAFGASFAAALLAIPAAWRTHRLALWLMAFSLLAIATSAALGLAAAVEWPTGRSLTYLLAVPSAAAVLGVAAASVAWAAWPRPSRPSSISPT